jgi:hypothetical protein
MKQGRNYRKKAVTPVSQRAAIEEQRGSLNKNPVRRKKRKKIKSLILVDDTAIIKSIIALSQKINSFSPEKLIPCGSVRLWNEAFRRFGHWDEIIDKCVEYKNRRRKIMLTANDILSEILKLASQGLDFSETTVKTSHKKLYQAALVMYDSWEQALVVAGIRTTKLYPEEHIMATKNRKRRKE